VNYGAPSDADAVVLSFLSFVPAVLLFLGFFCVFWPRQVVALTVLLTVGSTDGHPRLERLRTEAGARRIRAGGGVALVAGAGLMWVLLGA
jgi:hypothetical protein